MRGVALCFLPGECCRSVNGLTTDVLTLADDLLAGISDIYILINTLPDESASACAKGFRASYGIKPCIFQTQLAYVILYGISLCEYAVVRKSPLIPPYI